METKIITKMVEQRQAIYIAFDGKEFSTPHECSWYENELKTKESVKDVEELEIVDMRGTLPIIINGSLLDENIFKWYRVETKEQLDRLNKAYRNDVTVFPETYCIEYTEGYDGVWIYSLTDMLNRSKSFWNKLGYTADIKKES